MYTMRETDHSIIGAFGVTFKQRSQFVYKASTQCNGFYIRKNNWHKLMTEQD